MNRKVVGVFNSENEASNAIEQLKSSGYRADDISVVTRNKKDMKKIEEETGTMAPEGAAGGAATGGVLGGIGGLLAGLGALAIPGIGPLLAAGPLATTLAGVAVGAAGGGLVGGLIGLGIPEEEANEYNAMVDEGHILVIVDTEESNRSDVYRIFQDNRSLNRRYDNDYTSINQTAAANDTLYSDTPAMGASNLEANRMDGTSVGDGGLAASADLGSTRANDRLDSLDTDEARKLQLREERLDVSKNTVRSGEVEVHKDIVEEQKSIDVPVSHEEVVIERRSVDNAPTDTPIGADETIRVPVSEEQVEVNKRNVVTGEIEVHKREIEETEQVRDTVRREEARVDKNGSVEVREGSDELNIPRRR
ncbi:YsnF/AvaK domain-containing protein [Saccharibacillus sp. CPCC 101409]|uniref:YsnF/AvaK domain-containing protein n=1 Tax=Saccharibacillus sp. CPCC 101409 TaxID=3058041 RepID=UPI0026736727|nr:YsnF/AvaK domain-containing protein [Saccharibacillus sp. CPCC 101409]MDO3410449.1 YsnF/AvaK domain-containing protein [Saccharibacillus sp. CPCC 101409]